MSLLPLFLVLGASLLWLLLTPHQRCRITKLVFLVSWLSLLSGCFYLWLRTVSEVVPNSALGFTHVSVLLLCSFFVGLFVWIILSAKESTL